jgi:hypothetical protein
MQNSYSVAVLIFWNNWLCVALVVPYGVMVALDCPETTKVESCLLLIRRSFSLPSRQGVGLYSMLVDLVLNT